MERSRQVALVAEPDTQGDVGDRQPVPQQGLRVTDAKQQLVPVRRHPERVREEPKEVVPGDTDQVGKFAEAHFLRVSLPQVSSRSL